MLFSVLVGVFSVWAVAPFFLPQPVWAISNDRRWFQKLTKDDQKIINSDDIDDPLRDGTHGAATQIDWLYKKETRITDFLQAESAALSFAQRIINWTLTIIWLVALIYLIIAGTKMVTAAGDEKKFKDWQRSLRTAAIALFGVWLSALLVNFIIYLIDMML